jgi:hypothetical protein
VGAEKRVFSTVSKARTAARLGEAGNKLNAAENLRIATTAAQDQAVYDKLSGSSGAVSDALAKGARELAEGGNSDAVKQSTYEAVRAAISETVPGRKSAVSP